MTNLDDLIACRKAEKKRWKFYDRGKGAVSDLYVDITASGIATFCYKRPYTRFGVYRPETWSGRISWPRSKATASCAALRRS